MKKDDSQIGFFVALIFSSTLCFFIASTDSAKLVADEPIAAPAAPTDKIPEPPARALQDVQQLANDMLYQAILNELRSAKAAQETPTGEAMEKKQIPETLKSAKPAPKKESLSSQRSRDEWLAIESILRAARILERETKRNTLSVPHQVKLRGVVEQLRSNAEELLQPNVNQPAKSP